jgi:hypothetical protein
MRQRVVSELTTTFASRYSRVISLSEALDLDILAGYSAPRHRRKVPDRPEPWRLGVTLTA